MGEHEGLAVSVRPIFGCQSLFSFLKVEPSARQSRNKQEYFFWLFDSPLFLPANSGFVWG